MGKPATSSRPFQRLYIDILGPYPRSKRGNIGLLIVLDHLTKFHWICLMKKFTSSTIQSFLLENIFHVYGIPEQIISDNGSQFKASELNAFFTRLGIEHIYTALYSPQANASERVNRSLIAGIRAYLKKDQTLWDENLSSVSCALRNTLHQAIQTSPYHAVFGQDMITHGSSYKLLRNVRLLTAPTSPLSRDDSLSLIRHQLRKHISDAYQTNQRQYNLRTRPIQYSVGQLVFRKNFSQSSLEKKFSSKLAPLYTKARIKEKVGSNYYIVEDLDGKILGTFHAKDLRE